MKRLASLSMKDLGFNAKEIRKIVDGKKEAVFLARIGGIVVSHFTGEGKHGTWTGFKGNFIAVTKDNEQFSSGVAFMPENISKQIVERLTHGEIEIQLQADVYGIETDKNASGYAFLCEPVMSAESDERMKKIADQILSKPLPTTLQIAAPKKKAAA